MLRHPGSLLSDLDSSLKERVEKCIRCQKKVVLLLFEISIPIYYGKLRILRACFYEWVENLSGFMDWASTTSISFSFGIQGSPLQNYTWVLMNIGVAQPVILWSNYFYWLNPWIQWDFLTIYPNRPLSSYI